MIRGSPTLSVRVTPDIKDYVSRRTPTAEWLKIVIYKAICLEVETGYSFLTDDNDLPQELRDEYRLITRKYVIKRKDTGHE